MSNDFKLALRIIVIVAVLAVLAGCGWVYFVRPLLEHNSNIKNIQARIDRKQIELRQSKRRQGEMEQYRLISLPYDGKDPGHEHAVLLKYQDYLHDLFRKTRFKADKLPTGVILQNRANFGRNLRNKKEKPVYKVAVFDIRGQATVASMKNLLLSFKHAPLLHRIKSLTLEPADPKKSRTNLRVSMVIEALIVEGASKRAPNLLGVDERLVQLNVLKVMVGAPPGLVFAPWLIGPTGPLSPQKLALLQLDPDHDLIVRNNIFEGYEPPRPDKEVKDPPPPDPGPFMPKYTYLTQITRKEVRKEAFLYNRAMDTYTRLRESRLFGKFTIESDSEPSVTQFEGTVLKIEPRDVYFEHKLRIFRLHLGQNLVEATSYELSADELKKVGLKPIEP